MALLNIGMMGMTVALLIAGYEQSFIERAVGGSTWAAYFEGQTAPYFVQAMGEMPAAVSPPMSHTGVWHARAQFFSGKIIAFIVVDEVGQLVRGFTHDRIYP